MNSFLPASFLPSSLPKSSSKSESDVLLNIQGAPKPERERDATSFKKTFDVEASQQARNKRREQSSDVSERPKEKVQENRRDKTSAMETSEPDNKEMDRSNKHDAVTKKAEVTDDAHTKNAESNNGEVKSTDDNTQVSESGEIDQDDALGSEQIELQEGVGNLLETTANVEEGTLSAEPQALSQTLASQNASDNGEFVLAEETLVLDTENEAMPLNNGMAVTASVIASGTEQVSAATLNAPNASSDAEALLGTQAKTRFYSTEKIATNQNATQLSAATLEDLNLEEGSLSDFDENIETLKINADKRVGLSSTASGASALNANMGLTERAMTLTNERMARQSTQQWKGELIESAKSIESAAKTSALNPATQLSQQLNAAAETRVQMPVAIRFGQPAWAGMVAERSAMMAAQNLKFAELQLDPPELGPLQVKVTVNQEHAHVSFVAANANVRDALEQTVPKLRELLEEQGLDLMDVDVSDQESQQSEAFDSDGEGEASGMLAGEDSLVEEEADKVTVVAEYGVDSYA